jgi:hypothetical protein
MARRQVGRSAGWVAEPGGRWRLDRRIGGRVGEMETGWRGRPAERAAGWEGIWLRGRLAEEAADWGVAGWEGIWLRGGWLEGGWLGGGWLRGHLVETAAG